MMRINNVLQYRCSLNFALYQAIQFEVKNSKLFYLIFADLSKSFKIAKLLFIVNSNNFL